MQHANGNTVIRLGNRTDTSGKIIAAPADLVLTRYPTALVVLPVRQFEPGNNDLLHKRKLATGWVNPFDAI